MCRDSSGFEPWQPALLAPLLPSQSHCLSIQKTLPLILRCSSLDRVSECVFRVAFRGTLKEEAQLV